MNGDDFCYKVKALDTVWQSGFKKRWNIGRIKVDDPNQAKVETR